MSTVNKQITDSIIANNGYYISGDGIDSDPQVIAVVRYENQFNGKYSYAICYYPWQLLNYISSPACTDPIILAATKSALDQYKKYVQKTEETTEIAEQVYSYHISKTVTIFTEGN